MHRLQDGLALWKIVLVDGSDAFVLAHEHRASGEDIAFIVRMAGGSSTELELARVPRAACAASGSIDRVEERSGSSGRRGLSVVHTHGGDLGFWEIELDGGTVVRIRADAYGREGGYYDFVWLMEGAPYYELEVARFPKSAGIEPEGG
jgi:hypothetical protein